LVSVQKKAGLELPKVQKTNELGQGAIKVDKTNGLGLIESNYPMIVGGTQQSMINEAFLELRNIPTIIPIIQTNKAIPIPKKKAFPFLFISSLR